MAKVALVFDVADEDAEKLIPSVNIYAEITTYLRTIYVTNDSSMKAGNWFKGFNGKLVLMEEEK